jgi:Trypsin-co-occurring domain 1
MSHDPSGEVPEVSATEPEFYIQVGQAPGGSVVPQMSVGEFIEGSEEQFRQVGRVVEVAGNAFVDRMRKLATRPASCSIEFGVNAGGEAGIPFVVKGTAQANFKVTIQWDTSARDDVSDLPQENREE